MKILIAVTSCATDVMKGNNQAIRDTWGKNLPTNVDLRFFVGVIGTPGPLSTEHPDWQKDYQKYILKQKPWMAAAPPPLDRPLLPDEIALNVPDGYPYLTYKLRAELRWMVEYEYDFVFKTDVDTCVHIPRLLASGFEQHDSVGFEYIGKWSDRTEPPPGYAAGGLGFWLSNRACRLLMDAPVTFVADDYWVGVALKPHGIFVHHDPRYCWTWNDKDTTRQQMITVHLGGRSGSYDKRIMYDAYRRLMET